MNNERRDLWFISDTHFNHKPLVEGFGDLPPSRPFVSVEEMNEALIENWNSVVKKNDKVYHAGDVLFGHDKEGWMDKHWSRLNGIKRLIIGNHDNTKMMLMNGYFPKADVWRIFKDSGILLSHVPVAEEILNEERFDDVEFINVHGHTHGRMADYGSRHFCISAERINYTPVNMGELKSQRRKILGL